MEGHRMSHVEVFKTNVLKKGDAEKIIKALSPAFPTAMINFDLEDVNNILRVEVQEGIIRTGTIISLLI